MRPATKLLIAASLVVLAIPLGVALGQPVNPVPEVLTHLGATPDQGAEFASNMMPLDIVPYRFADNPSGEATLSADDFPWMRPNAIGADLVQLPSDFAGPSFPEGTVHATSGNGLVPGGVYGLFLASYDGEMTEDNMGGLYFNLSIPTVKPGADVWVPAAAFPADTWGGAGTIPYLTYGPNPWGLSMSQVQQDGSLADVPFDGFGFVGHGVSGFLVDIDSLVGPGGDWNELGFGFALHVHDGTFGSCDTCRSAIYASPRIGPESSLKRTFYSTTRVDMPLMLGGSTRVAPTTTTTTTTPTTTTTIQETTTTAASGTQTDTSSTGGGLPIVFVILIFIGLLVALGGGYLWYQNRDETTTATTEAPESWATTIASAPAQEMGTSVPASVATTPPSVVTKDRPGKGAGGDAETPPKIGVGGAIP